MRNAHGKVSRIGADAQEGRYDMPDKTETSRVVSLAGRRIDAYQLRYFLAVAEEGGFSRAADALYLAQPSLSQAIRTLERRLGTELFDRSAHPVCLTAAGERFAPAARELLADLDRARLAVHAVRDLRSGRLDIVTHAVFSVEPLVELVHRFRKAYDNILVNVLTAKSSEDARELVRHGAAELAIGYEAHDTEGLTAIPLPAHEVVLTAVPGILGSLPAPLPRESVADLPLIFDLGDRATATMLRQTIGTKKTPRVVVNCSNPTALWGLVSRGAGVTLLSRHVAEKYVPNAVVVSLHPFLYRTPALFARAEPLSPAATAFVALASEQPRSTIG
ncbi:MAG: LysR family transcriptional regulator [Rhodococcus sp. (in: high G+C Gram-positive bacteria)]|nr:MAG: LysR family transcriptional regulator [Rhodococcus sp. (in: high G+C Gram-positive bacteria)]